jgi:hypothetical protein
LVNLDFIQLRLGKASRAWGYDVATDSVPEATMGEAIVLCPPTDCEVVYLQLRFRGVGLLRVPR